MNENPPIPVPKALRRRLWYVVAGAGVFLTIAGIEGALRQGYDARQQSISALSLGPRGWIQVINFFVFGAVTLSAAGIWRTIMNGRKGAGSIRVFIILTGLSLIACGVFSQDPAPGYDPEMQALTAPSLYGLMHLFFAAICAISSLSALLIMARAFAGDPLWVRWSLYSMLMALAMIVCIGIYAVWSTRSSGFAGVFERVGAMIVPFWCLTFLLRLEQGRPFMKQG